MQKFRSIELGKWSSFAPIFLFYSLLCLFLPSLCLSLIKSAISSATYLFATSLSLKMWVSMRSWESIHSGSWSSKKADMALSENFFRNENPTGNKAKTTPNLPFIRYSAHKFRIMVPKASNNWFISQNWNLCAQAAAAGCFQLSKALEYQITSSQPPAQPQ